MLDTFLQSFRLRSTYKANGIIWSIKGIPLIKNLLPASLYASKELKIFANIVSGIIEFFTSFFGKALYLLAILMLVNNMKISHSDSFTHIILFLTIIGGFMNTNIFDPSKDKFYAIFLMRINAKQYTLTNYTYFMIKMFVGLTIFSLIFAPLAGVSLITCLFIPVYVICVKLCFTAYNLEDCKKKSRSKNENRFASTKWIAMVVLLALAALPYVGFALPELVLQIVAGVLVIPAIFAAIHIVKFDSYRPIYKELLKPENYFGNSGANTSGAAQQLAMQKKISADVTQTSNKKGYKYFNELFMKRHSKLLTKSAKRITIAAVALLGIAIAALFLFPDTKSNVNNMLMTYLPYFLFVMYLINSGKTITQAMFMNCDHSMLVYRFYRQPKAILSLFVERLKYIILINLMPAVVIGLGLPLLLYVSGGTTDNLNYLVLFVSIIAMSIFFSVHSMVLYYLLQPYNVNLEIKSGTYGIVNWVTYIVCYFAIQFKAPTLVFGIGISAFCIVYAVVAFILAYNLAPKTFKLRN